MQKKKTKSIFKEDIEEIKKMVAKQQVEDLLNYLLGLQEFLYVKVNPLTEMISFQIQDRELFGNVKKGITEEHHENGTYEFNVTDDDGGTTEFFTI